MYIENYLIRKVYKMIKELFQRNCIYEYMYNVYYIYLKCRKKFYIVGIVV